MHSKQMRFTTDAIHPLLDNAPQKALVQASSNGHLETVRLLLGRGGDADNAPQKALVKASWKGHLEVVRLLLEYGTDVINASGGRDRF